MLALKMALRSISSNKLRAFLTMLGIIIGVMALVVLVSLVSGATGSVTDAVSSLGSDMLTVSISDDKGEPIKLEELNRWMEEEDGLGYIAAYASESVTGKYNGENDSFTAYGVSPMYYEIQGLKLSMGRFIKNSDLENSNRVCVLNYAAATEMIGYVDCIGKEISLNGMKYTVVGVLDEDKSISSSFSSGSYIAYIPYTSLLRLSSEVSADITSFCVSAPEGSSMDETEAALDAILYSRFEDDDEAYSISGMDIMEDAMSSITSILSILLGGIAGISLVVGGIGIMNIMLVTVTERTREIGIRKAIGAERSSIVTQFLIEAAVICGIGGLIGIGFGYVGTMVFSKLLFQEVMMPTPSIAMGAFVFSAVLGVIFGMYPAVKASGLQPVAALRAD